MSKALLTVVLGVVLITVAALALGVTLLRITVTLGTPTPCGTACWDIVAASASASDALNRYTVVLSIEERGSPVSAPLAPGFSPQGVSLFFTDIGVPNHLDAGDSFRLENPGFPGTCTLSLNSFRASPSVTWAC